MEELNLLMSQVFWSSFFLMVVCAAGALFLLFRSCIRGVPVRRGLLWGVSGFGVFFLFTCLALRFVGPGLIIEPVGGVALDSGGYSSSGGYSDSGGYSGPGGPGAGVTIGMVM